MLSRMVKHNYLSQHTDTDSDHEYPKLNKLIGASVSESQIDDRLVKMIEKKSKSDLLDIDNRDHFMLRRRPGSLIAANGSIVKITPFSTTEMAIDEFSVS